MMIALSKKYTETKDDLEFILKGEVWRFAHDRGIPFSFLNDSQTINDGIDSIASRVAQLIESVRLDQYQIDLVKKGKQFEKDLLRQELAQKLAEMSQDEFDELMHQRKELSKIVPEEKKRRASGKTDNRVDKTLAKGDKKKV